MVFEMSATSVMNKTIYSAINSLTFSLHYKIQSRHLKKKRMKESARLNSGVVNSLDPLNLT